MKLSPQCNADQREVACDLYAQFGSNHKEFTKNFCYKRLIHHLGQIPRWLWWGWLCVQSLVSVIMLHLSTFIHLHMWLETWIVSWDSCWLILDSNPSIDTVFLCTVQYQQLAIQRISFLMTNDIFIIGQILIYLFTSLIIL